MKLFIIYYLLCVIYSFWQLIKNAKKSSVNDVVTRSLELEVLMIVTLGWVLVPIDLFVTLKRKLKKV